MDRPMDEKMVLITGAGRRRGMGAAAARKLAGQGAKVFIADICDEEGLAVASEIGAGCRYLHLDVTRPEDWRAALEIVDEEDGFLGLVNNAAYYAPGTVNDATDEDFDRHMQVNQLGPFMGMKIAAPLMRRRGGGSIVNVSSTSGLKASARAIAYCGTKWALRGMTKAAAVELARDGIRVNSIHPGPVGTDMIDIYSKEEQQARTALVPLKRNGTPEEIADLIAFLLSDASAYMTGSEIAIDGGITL